MIRKWRTVLLVAALVCAPTFAPMIAHAAGHLFSVDLFYDRTSTRVVLGLPQSTNFQVRLENVRAPGSPGRVSPGRLSVEFPGLGAQPDGTIGQGDGLVRSYRAEAMRDGGVRVILDLARPAVVVAVHARPADRNNPARAEISLKASTQAAMVAAANVAFHPLENVSAAPKPAPQSAAASNSIGALIEGSDQHFLTAPGTMPPPSAVSPQPGVLTSPPHLAKVAEAAIVTQPAVAASKKALLSKPVDPPAPPEGGQPKEWPAKAPPPRTGPILQAAIAPLGGPRVAAATSASKRTIVIDAGHGGVDPGAESVAGYHEKEITLATARLLRRQLEQTGRYKVVLTRDADIYLKLRERVRVAHAAHGSLFISLHADSVSGAQSARGASIYTLSETASDAESDHLAQRENRADAIGGVDLGDQSDDVAGILVDLTVRETVNDGNRLAGMMVDSLQHEGISLLPSSPHRSAGFAVLKSPDIPSVLIEMGYLSDMADARGLADPRHQLQIAKAVADGVDRYFTWVQAARS